MQEPDDERYDYNVIKFMWRMAIHPTFQAIFIFGTIVNLYVLSLVRYNTDLEKTKETIEFALSTLIYLNITHFFEIIIKLLAFDLKSYLASRMNIMELSLFLFFTSTFVLDQALAGEFILKGNAEKLIWTKKFAFLTAFRGLRLVHIMQNAKSLRLLLKSILYTLDNIGNFLLLLCLLIYVFALLGLQFFAGWLKFDKDGQKVSLLETDEFSVPRSNFDTIEDAFITTFQLIIGERWIEVFYDCWRARGVEISVAYFVGLIFFGNIIMMNLFLAMLLGNFEKASLLNGITSEEEKLKVLYPSQATLLNYEEKTSKNTDDKSKTVQMNDLRPCLKTKQKY